MTKVFFFIDHVLMAVDYDTPKMHKHLAKHIIFSLDDDLKVILEDNVIRCSGIILESNISHTIKSNQKNIIVLLIEETSNFSYEIEEKYLKGNNFCKIQNKMVEKIRQYLKEHNDIKDIDMKIFEVLNVYNKFSKKYDKRIKEILNRIDKMEGIYEDTIENLSRNVFLSKSRILHLFKEETGISLSSYLLMQKMEKTYKYIINNNENITSASIKAGFSSSSHFAMVCKKMFGLTSFKLNKDAEFVYIKK